MGREGWRGPGSSAGTVRRSDHQVYPSVYPEAEQEGALAYAYPVVREEPSDP